MIKNDKTQLEDISSFRRTGARKTCMPKLLRTSDDNTRIETSTGQSIPADACERIWALVCKTKRMGVTRERDDLEPFERNDIGQFRLWRAFANGSIEVGCEIVAFDEIARIAKRMNFEPYKD